MRKKSLLLGAALGVLVLAGFAPNSLIAQEDCESPWKTEAEGQGYGCTVYCVYGEEEIAIHCEEAFYTSYEVSWQCGNKNVPCPYDCEEKPYTGFKRITCNCITECPYGYTFYNIKYSDYTFINCDVCPSHL